MSVPIYYCSDLKMRETVLRFLHTSGFPRERRRPEGGTDNTFIALMMEAVSTSEKSVSNMTQHPRRQPSSNFCLLGLCCMNYVAFPLQPLISFVCAREAVVSPPNVSSQYVFFRIKMRKRDGECASLSLPEPRCLVHCKPCEYFSSMRNSCDDGK
jgi:hypothetical protein